ncbi:MAG: hypothetical protein ACRDKT_14280 [Actinomycetota bacterium]
MGERVASVDQDGGGPPEAQLLGLLRGPNPFDHDRWAKVEGQLMYDVVETLLGNPPAGTTVEIAQRYVHGAKNLGRGS